MRLLFAMDQKDYQDCTYTYVRNSARSIIITDGKVAMVHSAKYDYYKFPGGGIEANEHPIDALLRETLEEVGLQVLRHTVEEYGYVHRKLRSIQDPDQCFVQDNFYYICQVDGQVLPKNLDSYESDEGYHLVYVNPHQAITKNRSVGQTPYDSSMFEREERVLEQLLEEGCFELEQ